MNSLKNTDRALRFLTTCSLILIFILSMYGLIHTLLRADASAIISLSEGWVDDNGESFSLDSFSQEKDAAQNGQDIYYTLSVANPNTSVIFRSRNLYADVYVNDVLVSQDDRNLATIYGTSPGSRWHLISLDSADGDVVLRIHAAACYHNSNGLIDNIYAGPTLHIVSLITRERIPGFILSCFLQISGVILMLLFFYLRRHYDMGRDLYFLGIATFFSAQWSSAESQLWQLFFGHSELFHLVGYLSLIMIPIPLGILAFYRLNGWKRTFSKYYSFISCINLLTTSILHVTGILEFHYSLRFTHVLLFILIPVMIFLIQSYMGKNSSTNQNRNALVSLSLAMLIICVLSALIKYLSGQYRSYTAYTRIAILCFLFCLIVYQLNQVADMFIKGMRADVIHDMALTDYLTGLYNRTAFAEHTPSYTQMISTKQPLGIIAFDVNNLKQINDTFGHDKGDLLITSVSSALQNCFASCGNCYRMGGDEFLVILNGRNPSADYKRGIRTLQAFCQTPLDLGEESQMIEIAHGFVLNQGDDLSASLEQADALMYENKRNLKGE